MDSIKIAMLVALILGMTAISGCATKNGNIFPDSTISQRVFPGVVAKSDDPFAPQNVTAISASNLTILVMWNAPLHGRPTEYQVFGAEDGSDPLHFIHKGTVANATQQVRINGLEQSQFYFFEIVAKDVSGKLHRSGLAEAQSRLESPAPPGSSPVVEWNYKPGFTGWLKHDDHLLLNLLGASAEVCGAPLSQSDPPTSSQCRLVDDSTTGSWDSSGRYLWICADKVIEGEHFGLRLREPTIVLAVSNSKDCPDEDTRPAPPAA